MPSFSALAVLSSLILASVSVARPIPHTVTLFRRAILNANDGVLIVQHKDAPKSYAAGLEPYDRYHFRYMAVGCPDYDHNQVFFETCCHPRSNEKRGDSDYPMACRLNSYGILAPVYYKEQTVAKLGSLQEYQHKMNYDDAEEASSSASSSSSSSWSSSAAETSSYTPASSTWTSSYTPSYTPSSSSSTWSSSAPAYTPSSSSESWSSSSWWSSSSSWTPSSSSEAPAPTWSSSSSSSYSAPAPTSEWKAPVEKVAQVAAPSSSSWTPAPAPSSSAQTSNNGGQSFTGTGSWYTQNGNAGACGVYHSDSDYIVAMAAANYGNMGQKSPHCGQTITITNTNTGATANAVVADACPGCSSTYSLDLSTGLFQALASLDQGLIPISWHFD